MSTGPNSVSAIFACTKSIREESPASAIFLAVAINSGRVATAITHDHPPPPCRAEIEVVENEAQIGFARAQIGQNRLLFFFQNGVDRGLYQLRQMLHLFELAAAICIQPAIGREDVQRLQQRHGLPGPDILECRRAHLNMSRAWVTP